jgi:hypothetical protein
MALRSGYDLRSEILQDLWRRVEADAYPSATMMDRIELMLTPDEVPAYAEMLMQKIRPDTYPSIDLINRVVRLYCVYEDVLSGVDHSDRHSTA